MKFLGVIRAGGVVGDALVVNTVEPITRADYEAIAEPDPTTLYVITD